MAGNEPDPFAEAKSKHKIGICRICQENLKLKAEGSNRGVFALDGIHGNSLVG